MATVSTDATETTLQLYSNPLLIQDKQLSLFEDHVFGGKAVLDGNNVFTFGLEMDATMTASIVNEMANNFQSLYPARAMTMSDLYRHLSDYDYVDMFSTPSSTTIELMFDRDYLINNAPVNESNTDENLVVIPSFSTFTIGEHTFGIHYPIKISIRKAYKSDGTTIDYDNTIFQCSWDTSTINPLYRLTSNILEHRIYQRDGIHMICISIPIQQFKVQSEKEDTISSTGFVKRYTYTDRFYAIRVFHYLNNTWTEMSETLSDVVYNASDPTAHVKVLSDVHTIEVTIPQVYFTEGLIGNRIMCLIYTTEGALDLDIRSYNASQFSASFLIDDKIEDDTYSAFLKRVPLLQVVPLSSRISNGSNGKTFEEMKNRVINSVGGDDLLVTTQQIEAHLVDTGFQVSKYIDNITDRIYIASRVITDANTNVIGSGEYKTTITDTILKNAGTDGSYNTIKVISETPSVQEYMIMPDTVFKYDEDSDSMIPLDRYEVKQLFKEKTTEEMIKELNNQIYTFTPFHIKLSASASLPMAGAYDLLKPYISGVTFKSENTGTITQVSMFGQYIEHKSYGTDGYRFTVALYTTDDLKDLEFYDEQGDPNIVVILRTTNSGNSKIYLQGTYIGKNSDDRHLIAFDIATGYKLTASDTIDTDSFTLINDNVDVPNTNYLALEQEYELLFFIKRGIKDISDEATLSEEAISQSTAQSYIPKIVKYTTHVWLATQELTLHLGEAISSLMCNTSVTVQGAKYATYPSTEYAAYATDVYARYMNDVKDDEGKIIHYAGELIIDSSGNLSISHYTGDLILSSDTDTGEGLRAPSYTITTVGEEEDGSDVKRETLYMDSQHRTATASNSNIWYPFRAYQVDDDLWQLVYTGATTEASTGAKLAVQASITEVQDLLKLMIDNCYVIPNDDTKEAVATTFMAKRIRTEYDDSGAVTKRVGYTIDDETGNYVLTNDTIPAGFIYVKKGNGDSATKSPFLINIEDGKYVLINNTLDSSNLVTTAYRPWSQFGALYRRDSEASALDYAAYINENNLCKFYMAIDAIPESATNRDAQLKEIYESFDIDSDIAAKLEKFRAPWTKVIEVFDDSTYNDPTTRGLNDIVNYWNNREYMNFTKEFTLVKHEGTEPASGVLALRYIQDRSVNINEIIDSVDPTMTDETEAQINSDSKFRLYWVSNYNVDDDGTKVDTTPLITELEVSASQTRGALLWATHVGGSGVLANRHYIVITGPSKEDCYNYMMSQNMLSGYAYVTKVYDTSGQTIDIVKQFAAKTAETEAAAEKAGREIIENSCTNLYTLIHMCTSSLNEDDVDIQLLTSVWGGYWPWETSNWIVLPQQDAYKQYAGKSINYLGITMTLGTDTTDAKFLHVAGDVALDSTGTPVTNDDEDSRKLIYHVNTIQCDYKLLKCESAEYTTYRQDIQELLRSYFELLNSTKPLLLERTELYYSPIKSMGYGNFKGANSDEILHTLEITVDLRLHVTAAVAASETTKDQIRTNVITLVEQHISDGNISCAVLANEIRNSMSDSVLYVDVLGINGDPDVQTLISTDTSKYAVRLKTVLELDDDGSVQATKGVNITWATMK